MIDNERFYQIKIDKINQTQLSKTKYKQKRYQEMEKRKNSTV